jgi:filamentous hemagglutinin family protein
MNKKTIIFVIISIVFTSNITAEVIFDDTGIELKGTESNGYHMKITDDYGKLSGNNLYHSFSKFNINQNEIATFSGPEHVQNIISRVTGGEMSMIHGTLRSEIPHANFFLLNPAGVFFGKESVLDVKGSFHVSTADYLVMDNHEKFDIHSSEPLLSMGTPVTFGFIDDGNGVIEVEDVEGGNFIDPHQYDLKVDKGETLSLIGGEIIIKASMLYAPEGIINIAAIKSAAEISLIDSGMDYSVDMIRGKINISEYSTIDVSSNDYADDINASGDVFILGSEFILDESYITAKTEEASENAGIININVDQMKAIYSEITCEYYYLPDDLDLTGGNIKITARESIDVSDYSIIATSTDGANAGYIDINAKNVLFHSGSYIESKTYSSGKAGDISIEASENITFNDNCTIYSDTDFSGDAGNIDLNAKNIFFLNGSGLGNQTADSGNGGNISLNAVDSIQFMGTDQQGIASDITTYSKGSGNAGDVNITAHNILFKNGGRVYASALEDGSGGNIRITAENGIINLSGVNPHGENSNGFNSCISSESEQTGKAGDIYIKSDALFIDNGAYISNNTSDIGESGAIIIETDTLEITGKAPVINQDQFLESQHTFIENLYESKKKEFSGIYSRAESQNFSDNPGGEIHISGGNIFLSKEGTITTSSTGKRDAGNIELTVNSITMDSNSSIASESLAKEEGGTAGEISLNLNNSMTLRNTSHISTDAQSSGGGKINIKAKETLYLLNSSITTNVKDGSGHGGDINIDIGLSVLNHSQISANAIDGDGGAVFIVAENFIKSTDSRIEATSERGNEGTVKIDAPDIDISKDLAAMPSKFLDASQWMKNSCGQRSSENISRLIVKGKDAVPTKPDDLHASPAITFQELHLKQPDIADTITKAENFSQKGDFLSAANTLYDAEQKLNLQSTDYLVTMTCLIQTLQSIGFHNKALNLANKALPIAEKSPSSAERIMFYNTYGDLLLSLNELPDAINYLKVALKHAKATKNPILMAAIMNNIANVVVVDGDVETGIQIYDNALALLRQSNKNGLKAKIYLNLAFVISMLGTYEEAIVAFHDALSFIQTLSDNHEKAFAYISLSKTGLMIDQFFPDKKSQSKICFALLESAQAIGEQLNDLKILSMASGNAAKILEKSGQYPKALKKTRYAIFTADLKKYNELAYKWYWQAGRLFKKMGKETQAIHSYKRSISILSTIREELFNGIRLKTDIFEIDVKPVYLGLTEIYLDQADRESNPKVREQKILMARDVMERLKNEELSDYFEDECVASKQKIKSNTLNRTPEGIALLYPIALPDRLTVLITLPDTIKHYNVDIRYQELNKIVRSYRKYIQVRSSNQFLGGSQKIYQLLIRPVEKDLIAANIHTLLVAPDGVLRLVPFSSLHDKKKFLIEKYAIVTIPSINMTDTTSTQYNKEETETLVVGLSDAVQDFSALPSINEELRDIKKIMNGKTMYKNSDYTIANVQNEFKTNDYNIVHFATHGVFGGTGKNSFLLTYEGQLDMNKLEDLMSLGKYRNHQVDMLTLSACQTALGNERAALGLAGVAVKAGVRSAVATLWYVDDQATSLAIRELYRQLKKDNMTKAQALQNAQKKLLSMHRYWHPIYWAPFLLIGSWI